MRFSKVCIFGFQLLLYSQISWAKGFNLTEAPADVRRTIYLSMDAKSLGALAKSSMWAKRDIENQGVFARSIPILIESNENLQRFSINARLKNVKILSSISRDDFFKVMRDSRLEAVEILNLNLPTRYREHDVRSWIDILAEEPRVIKKSYGIERTAESVMAADIMSVLPQLNSLNTLSLVGWCDPFISRDEVTRLIESFPNLERINVGYIGDYDWKAFLKRLKKLYPDKIYGPTLSNKFERGVSRFFEFIVDD